MYFYDEFVFKSSVYLTALCILWSGVMDWSDCRGLESWSGVLERILGVETWSKIECNRKVNSGGEICLGANVSHYKMCNKSINCTSNG